MASKAPGVRTKPHRFQSVRKAFSNSEIRRLQPRRFTSGTDVSPAKTSVGRPTSNELSDQLGRLKFDGWRDQMMRLERGLKAVRRLEIMKWDIHLARIEPKVQADPA